MMNETEKLEYLERDVWVKEEVIALLNGYYPPKVFETENDYEIKRKFQRTSNALEEAVGFGVLRRKVAVSNSESFQAYSSNEIIEWARNKRATFPDFPFLEKSVAAMPAAVIPDDPAQKTLEKPLDSLSENQHGKWPWGNHETKRLKSLAEAAKRFWTLYDPADISTAPTNEQVTSWLKAQGVPQRTAEIMAQILRADGLPPGPRK